MTPSMAPIFKVTHVQLQESKLILVFTESWFHFQDQKSQGNIFYQDETTCNLPVESIDSRVIYFSCNPGC